MPAATISASSTAITIQAAAPVVTAASAVATKDTIAAMNGMNLGACPAPTRAGAGLALIYGAVVDSVNVNVLA